MGLDNGIYVKSTKREINRDMLPEGIQFPFQHDYDNRVEILYWRKNCGLRDTVMNHFGWRDTILDDKYEFIIEKPSQVMELIEIIASFLDENKWENEGRSIWDYVEEKPILIQNIINLSIMYTFMLNNPDIYLVFYDSY